MHKESTSSDAGWTGDGTTTLGAQMLMRGMRAHWKAVISSASMAAIASSLYGFPPAACKQKPVRRLHLLDVQYASDGAMQVEVRYEWDMSAAPEQVLGSKHAAHADEDTYDTRCTRLALFGLFVDGAMRDLSCLSCDWSQLVAAGTCRHRSDAVRACARRRPADACCACAAARRHPAGD